MISGQTRSNRWSSSWSTDKPRETWVGYFKKTFTIRSATSDRHPDFFEIRCVFASSQTQLTERDGVCTQNTLPGACHSTLFLVSTHCAVAQDKVVSASFTVIPHSHPHHPDCPQAHPASHWRESGRLTDSATNTGCEPNLADFSNYVNTEHNPIDIHDNNPDFWCSDDVTMISDSARGMPNSEASSSSRKTAASKVSFLFGHTSLRETRVGHVSSRSGPWETEAELDRESVATTFVVHSREWKEIESWILCMRWEMEITSKRSLNGKLTRPFRERKAQQKLCQAEAEIEAKNWEKRNRDHPFQEINQELESQRFRWNRQANKDKLSMQQLRNPTTVSQVMTQNQDLQNKVNYLSDAREFHDPECGSSSGATHVPDQTSTILNSRTLPRCDSGLPRTHRICVRVFWETFVNDHLLKKDNPPQSSTIQRIWHLHLKMWDLIFQRQPGEKMKRVSLDTPLFLTVVWWIIREFLLRNGILENFLTLWNFKVGSLTSGLKFLCAQPNLKSLCCGPPGGRGPQKGSTTGGGEPARVPNLRVCKNFCMVGGTCWRRRAR